MKLGDWILSFLFGRSVIGFEEVFKLSKEFDPIKDCTERGRKITNRILVFVIDRIISKI
jgi:hypothetical protein